MGETLGEVSQLRDALSSLRKFSADTERERSEATTGKDTGRVWGLCMGLARVLLSD